MVITTTTSTSSAYSDQLLGHKYGDFEVNRWIFVTFFVGRSRYGPLIYPGLALANDGLQDDKAETLSAIVATPAAYFARRTGVSSLYVASYLPQPV